MDRFLRYLTACEVPVGPFVDETDGKTAETGLTIAYTDVWLKKGEADWVNKGETTALVHEKNGFYRCLLNAVNDCNPVGNLTLSIHVAGALPVFHHYLVLPDQVYSALVMDSEPLKVNVTRWANSNVANPNTAGVPIVDIARWLGTTVPTPLIGGVPSVDPIGISGGVLSRTTIATLASQTSFTLFGGSVASADNNAYVGCRIIIQDSVNPHQKAFGIISAYVGATKTVTLAADPGIFTMAVGDIVTILPPATPGTLGTGAISAATFAAGAIDAAAIAADAIGASELAATAVAEIADAVWDELMADHLIAGSLSAVLFDIDTIIVSNQAGIAAIYQGLGALTDAAADGDPTSTDTLMAYVKQLVNTLVGSAGIVTWPAEAAPGNAVSIAEALRAIHADTNALPNSGALTTLQADLDDIQTRLPAALVGGRMDSSVGAMAANVLTATAINADAITAAKIAPDAIGASELAGDAVTEIQSGLATSAALTTAQTAITAIKAKTDQFVFTNAGKVDAAILAAGDFVQAAADKVWSTAARILTAGTNIVLAKGVGLTGLNDLDAAAVTAAVPTAAVNADAVWDELRSGHVAAGSFGQALQTFPGGQAQGGDATHIQLAAGASAADDEYNNLIVMILFGTGKGQFRPIDDYVGATRQALVSTWATIPDATSRYALVGV